MILEITDEIRRVTVAGHKNDLEFRVALLNLLEELLEFRSEQTAWWTPARGEVQTDYLEYLNGSGGLENQKLIRMSGGRTHLPLQMLLGLQLGPLAILQSDTGQELGHFLLQLELRSEKSM